MNQNLKLCPFCGGEAKINSKTMNGDVNVWASCKECGASSAIYARSANGFPRRTMPDDAWFRPVVAAWNRRIYETD